MSITLYGASLSPFVRKLRAALVEKGLEFEQVQVDPFRQPPNYRELSPFGRIPALRDGDKVLADSGVICAYLDAQYPQNSLIYTDPYLRAQVQWFEKFGDYELAPVLTFGVFRNRVLMRFLGKPCDEQHVASCLTGTLPSLPGFDRLKFWRGTLAVATYATVTAKALGVDEDGAYVSGLMLRTGQVLMAMVDPVAFQQVAGLKERVDGRFAGTRALRADRGGRQSVRDMLQRPRPGDAACVLLQREGRLEALGACDACHGPHDVTHEDLRGSEHAVQRWRACLRAVFIERSLCLRPGWQPHLAARADL